MFATNLVDLTFLFVFGAGFLIGSRLHNWKVGSQSLLELAERLSQAQHENQQLHQRVEDLSALLESSKQTKISAKRLDFYLSSEL